MTAGCTLTDYSLVTAPSGFAGTGLFSWGVADDPTDISSVLRGTGKDYFACPVGY